jgi:PKD repeat protein
MAIPGIDRFRGVRFAAPVLVVLAVLVLPATQAASSPLQTTTPALQLARIIRTHPFVNSSVHTLDGEGSAFVPRDDSLWLVDDSGKAAYEVDPDTGYLKRVVGAAAWAAAPQYGGGPLAGASGAFRYSDLESAAYDQVHDILYMFSGKCCSSSELPTVFRLQRDQNGIFQVDSYQPLPAGTDYTAAGWDPADGKIYVGVKANLRAYDYATNVSGPIFHVPNLGGILGLSFSDDGSQAFVVGSVSSSYGTKLYVIDWAGKKIQTGWPLDLTPFGVLDARAVEYIRGQFYVFDGKSRPASDPLDRAVFVLNVLDASGAPSASFTTSTSTGPAPLSVRFTNTSTGATGVTWDFGDGSPTDTTDSPTHIYNSPPGNYTVTLTASNGTLTSTAQAVIVVTPPQGPAASFTTSTSTGPAPLSVRFTNTSTGATGVTWDFGDGSPTDTTDSPTHIYDSPPGNYTVTLTASNGTLTSTAQAVIVVTPPSTGITATIVADSYIKANCSSCNFGATTTVRGLLGSTEERPYITFSVHGLSGPPSSAKLRLFVTDASPSAGTWYPVDPNWSETVITWNNAPPIDPNTAFATPGTATKGTWVEIDVTSLITGDGIYSVAMKTLSSDSVQFSSREGSNPPQLLVAP